MRKEWEKYSAMTSTSTQEESEAIGYSSVTLRAKGVSGPDTDEYTIINPDFWAEGVDSSKFKGWSNLSEVSILLMPYQSCF